MGMITMFPAGGGAKLNIKAYASALLLPASAKEGAVGVITSTALGDVYALSSAPASPVAGDIWLLVGASSVAPIALTDEFKLYPTQVTQYNGTTWDQRISYVYTGGAWVPLSTALYDYGTFILANDIDTIQTINGSIGKASDHITVTASRGEGIDAIAVGGFDVPIDVTNLSAIKAYINQTYSASPGGVYLGLSVGKNTSFQASAASTSTGVKTLTIDVSALSGNYYVMLKAYNQGGWYSSVQMYVYKVYYVS